MIRINIYTGRSVSHTRTVNAPLLLLLNILSLQPISHAGLLTVTEVNLYNLFTAEHRARIT